MEIQEGVLLHQGANFKYRLEGIGFPTLVIGSALYYPKSFSNNLRKKLRMAFIDWRGFAERTSDESPIGLDAYIEDIEWMRKKLQLGKVMVMGHSAHALLALEYAKRYPESVSAIVMIGISPNLSPKYAELAEKHWIETASAARKEAFERSLQASPKESFNGLTRSESFIKWYICRDPQAWYDFNFNSSYLWEGIELQMNHFDELYGVALRDLDIAKKLKELHQPVFLAMGKCDYIVAPADSWEPIRPAFHSLTLKLFEKSGHSPQLEESSLFNQELLTWFESSFAIRDLKSFDHRSH